VLPRGSVYAVPADQKAGPWRWHHAAVLGVPPAAGRSGGERRLEHLAGLARVADDENLRCLAAADAGGRAPERGGELGGEELAGDAANAVGAEELARRDALAAVHGRL
jgi:hypothetical protein